MSTRIPYPAPMTADLPDDLFLIHPDDTGGPATPTLSFSRSPTVLLNFTANRFTRSAARAYQDRFGIGAMDWRMLVMLAREPSSTAAHASRTIGIDKAAVSRALARLEAKGLVAPADPDQGRLGREWVLTDTGIALHGQVLTEALARQKALLDGFSPEEVAQFTGFLSRCLGNLDKLESD
ncbi:MarR family winged helix-turn-helix transcriptional regulator [Nioella sp.]|uniref:MarR family winged helix-turn-helix transcriptional regulator n=1 Tax=Nioella sp. TaxID=1912091 RepID=UPI003B51DD1C